jgi:hypothetical protein
MTFKQRLTAGILAALSLAAAAAPASATPWDPSSRDPFIPIRPAPEPAMVAPAPSHAGRAAGTGRAAEIVRITTDRGFAWSDAAMGAAGGIALSLVGVGGFLVASEARPRRTSATKALPN